MCQNDVFYSMQRWNYPYQPTDALKTHLITNFVNTQWARLPEIQVAKCRRNEALMLLINNSDTKINRSRYRNRKRLQCEVYYIIIFQESEHRSITEVFMSRLNSVLLGLIVKWSARQQWKYNVSEKKDFLLSSTRKAGVGLFTYFWST